ncbi:MAG: protein-export chaperone SecB [Pseudomonadota bacterium]
MSTSEKPQTGENQDNPQAPQGLPLVIHSQYIKDLSFESPNAPQSMYTGQNAPKMDIDINLDAAPIEHDKIENFYEVQLILNVTANRGQSTVFIVELVYAASVSLNNVPENKHHPILLAQTPHFLFPYARQIISDLVQQGGFPPLMLNPVNFRQMYLNRFGTAPTGDINEEVEETEKSA